MLWWRCPHGRKHQETEVSVPSSLLLEAPMQPHPTSLCMDTGGCTHTHTHQHLLQRSTQGSTLCFIACDDVWVCAKPLQSCLTLCHPMDCSPPGSSVRGILQARVLEWVARPSPGDLPNPGIEPVSPMAPVLQADSLPLSHRGSHY